MDDKQQVQISKRLSYLLRHRPEEVGLRLDHGGWASVDAVLQGFVAKGWTLTRAELDLVVLENSKQRFAFSADGRRIRASQGHSVDVDLGYAPASPPPLLYHGTADRNLPSILSEGIHRASRHHVHLSMTREVALETGQRHGRPVVITVLAGEMASAGHEFYVSANGVWLTEHVPSGFLDPEDVMA